jgi:hypothetical protein
VKVDILVLLASDLNVSDIISELRFFWGEKVEMERRRKGLGIFFGCWLKHMVIPFDRGV